MGYNLSMVKKITIKDIAKESGVSIATVSYVLNGREDKRISEETKNKVLHIANLYNYTSSFSARHISTGKTNIVALYLCSSDFALVFSERYKFVSVLLSVLDKEGYSVRIMRYGNAQRLDNVDAIICFDTPVEFFREVSSINFVPVLSYNSFINDGLFYQINTDYDAAKAYATERFGSEDFAVASLTVGNEQRRNELQKVFPQIKFVDDFAMARQLLKEYRNLPLLVLEYSLYEYLLPFCTQLCIYLPYKEKVAVLVQKMKDVIDRQDIDNYDIRL